MQIKISKTVEEEIEIPTPCFAKRGNDHYAILSEDTILGVWTSANFIMIQRSSMKMDFNKAADYWLTGEKLTEEQFFEVYNKALESLSFQPKLKETGFIGDLETIGLKRKEATENDF